jgi:diacylglycerol kinase (ATP)
MKDILRIWKSVGYALKGFYHAYRSDKSFRLEVRIGFPIYLILGWVFFPFTPSEFAFFVLSYLFILTIELVNTAFEKMLDRIHPEQHELIGKSKDISSAAVLMSFIFALFVNGILLYTRIHVNFP